MIAVAVHVAYNFLAIDSHNVNLSWWAQLLELNKKALIEAERDFLGG
jgi:hypothetical protein